MGSYYLIDGYNLIHAMGFLHGRVGPQGLEKARLHLLGMLVRAFEKDAERVTVVFDASRAPPGAAKEEDYHGLHILYAQGPQEADDVIETLLQHHSSPKQLFVISDDHRVQEAGRRRHAGVMSCGEFLDFTEALRRGQPARPAAPEKRDHVSKEETLRWLEEFRDLDNDPAMKELFDPFGQREDDR